MKEKTRHGKEAPIKVPRSQSPSSRPSNKKFSTPDTWSAELICDWLNSGYSQWLHPPADKARANAFFPLKFIEEEDASHQIEAAAEKKAWLSPNLPQGLDLALQDWRPFRGLDMLAELFDLAARVGAPRLTKHSMRLIRNAAVSEAPGNLRADVVSAMTSAVTSVGWDEASAAFVRELHLRDLWQPSLEARVMLARLRADADDWLSIAAGALPGIIADTKSRPKLRKLCMSRMVDTISLDRVMAGLAASDLAPECLALILILFCDDEPVLRLSYETKHAPNRSPEANGLIYRSREYPSPDPETTEHFIFMKFIRNVRDAGAIFTAEAARAERKNLAERLTLLAIRDQLHVSDAPPHSSETGGGQPYLRLAVVNNLMGSKWGRK